MHVHNHPFSRNRMHAHKGLGSYKQPGLHAYQEEPHWALVLTPLTSSHMLLYRCL